MEVRINHELVKAQAWAIQQNESTGLTVYADDSEVTGVVIEVILKANEMNLLATRGNMLYEGIEPTDEGRFIITSEPPEPADICGPDCCGLYSDVECCGDCGLYSDEISEREDTY